MTKIKLFLFAKILVLCVAFVFASAVAGQAQIVFDASASGSGETNPTISWQHTVGNGNNRILVVGLGVNVANPYPPASSVTYAGQPLTRQVLNNTGFPVSEIWTLVNPPTGTANVVVTHPSEGVITGGSASFSGVDQTTPVRASNSAREPIFTPSGTISTSVTTNPGDVVIDSFTAYDSFSRTPGAGQTLRWSSNFAALAGFGSTKTADSNPTTVSWNVQTSAVSPAALSAISLIPAQSLTPSDMIDNLTESVQSFNLPRGTENALLAKLYAALESIEAGEIEDARGSLGAFINQCNAQRGNKLTNEQADELIEAAEVILEALE